MADHCLMLDNHRDVPQAHEENVISTGSSNTVSVVSIDFTPFTIEIPMGKDGRHMEIIHRVTSG
jgi:hypothetical protein